MKNKFLFSALVVLLLVLSACASGNNTQATSEPTGSAAVPITGSGTETSALSTSVSTSASTQAVSTSPSSSSGTSTPALPSSGTSMPATSSGTSTPSSPSGAAGTTTPASPSSGTTTPVVPVTGNSLCPTSPSSSSSSSSSYSSNTAMPAGTSTPASGSSSSSAVSGPAQVNICFSQIFGDYLVDAKGMTVYVYAKDPPSSNTSNCTGACATTWPPFLTQGTPTVGSNATASDGTKLDSSKLGTMSLSDGTTQVTFNGWPLYYFTGDKAPGDINGELFFVMPPKGPAGMQPK